MRINEEQAPLGVITGDYVIPALLCHSREGGNPVVFNVGHNPKWLCQLLKAELPKGSVLYDFGSDTRAVRQRHLTAQENVIPALLCHSREGGNPACRVKSPDTTENVNTLKKATTWSRSDIVNYVS